MQVYGIYAGSRFGGSDEHFYFVVSTGPFGGGGTDGVYWMTRAPVNDYAFGGGSSWPHSPAWFSAANGTLRFWEMFNGEDEGLGIYDNPLDAGFPYSKVSIGWVDASPNCVFVVMEDAPSSLKFRLSNFSDEFYILDSSDATYGEIAGEMGWYWRDVAWNIIGANSADYKIEFY